MDSDEEEIYTLKKKLKKAMKKTKNQDDKYSHRADKIRKMIAKKVKKLGRDVDSEKSRSESGESQMSE